MVDLVPIKGGLNGRRPTIELHRLDALPERPHREEVIHKLLAVGEIGAIVAPAGQGKSAVAQLLATCIAEGRPFLGREVMRGPSIYVAAERGNGSVRRLLAIRRKSKAPLYIATARPNLASPADVDDLAANISQVCESERSCPVLIVFDTLARCMPGLDENSARDMGLVIEGLTRLSELVPSAAILFVHHAGKGGSGDMRGSTALIGGIDLEVRVESRGKSKRLSVTKANDVSEDQYLSFQLKPIEFQEHPNAEVETAISAVEVDPDDEQEQLQAELFGHGQPSRSEGLIGLIDDMASEGVVDRQACLAAARNRKLIEGKTPASTAEQFRKLLIELKTAGLIEFDNRTISLGLGATPNRPNGPPKGGPYWGWGLGMADAQQKAQ
ncbi:MAG: AAA family ATPase [Bradyrhizobium sp.]|nr:AAA family ATPase [Bradyrhizobium sp.]